MMRETLWYFLSCPAATWTLFSGYARLAWLDEAHLHFLQETCAWNETNLLSLVISNHLISGI